MFENIKNIINSVIEEFKNGDIPTAISLLKFPKYDIPCTHWSLMNQLLVMISGTTDARGYRQWGEVNRHVKKGAKSFKILVPCFKKKNETDDEKYLSYFTSGNVFKVEDTEGEELNYKTIELPDLPLLDRARELGLEVKAVGGNDSYFGYYVPSRKTISLASPEEKIFFHEFAHFADEQANGKLKNGQEPLQEIVAELCAEVLCRIVCKVSNTTGNSYRYIEHYAKDIGLTPHTACLKVISRVDKALNLILKGKKIEKLSSH